MELGAVMVGLILLVMALIFVLRPFNATGEKTIARVDPDEGRMAALSALRDLDFDFHLGKVSQEDYPGLRTRLMAEAAKYVELEKDEDERIEALIRARKTAVARDSACAECGEKLEAGTRFCPHCGTQAGAICPSCGGATKAGDLFCSSCGIKLEAQPERGTGEPGRSGRAEATA